MLLWTQAWGEEIQKTKDSLYYKNICRVSDISKEKLREV